MRAGIMVNSLGISQLSMCLITEINKIGQLDIYTDVIIFYHEYDRLLKSPRFAMLQEQEAWGFNAPIVSTNIETTNRLISFPGPIKKFFYVWDLEWIFHQYDVEQIARIYCHKNINLIARSTEHFDIISSCWKEPVAIVEDFNYEQLIRTIS